MTKKLWEMFVQNTTKVSFLAYVRYRDGREALHFPSPQALQML